MRTLLFAALAATLLVGAAAPPPPAKETTIGDLIQICRLAFAEQIAGGKPVKAIAAVNALAEDVRPIAISLCAAYAQGQADLAAVLQAKPALEKGGTSI